MPLAVCGIYEQVEQRWSLTVTSKAYLPWHSLLTGTHSVLSSRLVLILYRYQIATGASDDTIRIWDMRSLKALYTIPAHLSNVSDVRFFRSDGSIPAHIVQRQASSPTHINGTIEESEESNGDEGKDDSAPPPPMTAEQKQEALAQEWRYRPGLYFASAGYDGVVKIWSADDWQLLTTLQTDGSKVMSVDLSTDSKLLASGTYNRNYQLFSCESGI